MSLTILDNKQQYRAFCLQEKSIPIFSRDWWLDAVCGEKNWDVAIVQNNNQIIGTLPYYKKVKMGKIILSQPSLTPRLGPWIRPAASKYAHELGHQKDVMELLIKQLPKYSHFIQHWPCSVTNWLPFFWNGFQQTTLYTYVLNDLENLDKIWGDFQENIRRDIRKAQKTLTVKTDMSVDDFMNIQIKTYARQNLSLPFSKDLFLRIHQACLHKNCSKIFSAVDEKDRVHAALYIVWDENSAYGLVSGRDPDLKSGGSAAMLLWEAIQFCSTTTKKFDFSGSMIEPIERFLRAFGAIQTPYFRLFKTPSRLLKITNFLRTF